VQNDVERFAIAGGAGAIERGMGVVRDRQEFDGLLTDPDADFPEGLAGKARAGQERPEALGEVRGAAMHRIGILGVTDGVQAELWFAAGRGDGHVEVDEAQGVLVSWSGHRGLLVGAETFGTVSDRVRSARPKTRRCQVQIQR
jgi:hypothetical protein